jgi:hypothetical protein
VKLANFLILSSIPFAAATASACDLCGCALIPHRDYLPRVGWYAGASEQFTRYKTLQQDGHEIGNDARQKLDSSITQIFLGYNVTRTFGVQVNVPFIYRSFRRSEETGIDEGSLGGLGDVSMLASWIPIFKQDGDITFSLKLTGGIKFPTGDSDRVKEEGAEDHHHSEAAHSEGEDEHAEEMEHEEEGEAQEEAEHEHAPESGVHGHDLALGTGSVDGIVGGSVYARWQRLFVSGEVQYANRGSGKHDYDFANDLLWSGGIGVVLIDRDPKTLAVQFVCSGETKGEDEFRGVRSNDTSVTTVFLGPKITGTWRDRLTADIELGIPVLRENSGLQVVPDYRLRAGLSWSF